MSIRPSVSFRRAVVTGGAGGALAPPVFGHFLNKSCKILHLMYNFPLIFPLRYPGFKKLTTALLLIPFLSTLCVRS